MRCGPREAPLGRYRLDNVKCRRDASNLSRAFLGIALTDLKSPTPAQRLVRRINRPWESWRLHSLSGVVIKTGP
jgi:hypothetical protein